MGERIHSCGLSSDAAHANLDVPPNNKNNNNIIIIIIILKMLLNQQRGSGLPWLPMCDLEPLGIYEHSGLISVPSLSKKAGALCHLFIIFRTAGRRAADSITALQRLITRFTCSWTACAQARGGGNQAIKTSVCGLR